MTRRCAFCGIELRNARKDAKCCSARCRAHLSRLKRLLDGETPDGYESLDDYLAVRQKRTGSA